MPFELCVRTRFARTRETADRILAGRDVPRLVEPLLDDIAVPVRYALNAAAGSAELDAPEHAVPNATPYLFGEAAFTRAAERIAQLAG